MALVLSASPASKLAVQIPGNTHIWGVLPFLSQHKAKGESFL
jgi:hypothetical protein